MTLICLTRSVFRPAVFTINTWKKCGVISNGRPTGRLHHARYPIGWLLSRRRTRYLGRTRLLGRGPEPNISEGVTANTRGAWRWENKARFSSSHGRFVTTLSARNKRFGQRLCILSFLADRRVNFAFFLSTWPCVSSAFQYLQILPSNTDSPGLGVCTHGSHV